MYICISITLFISTSININDFFILPFHGVHYGGQAIVIGDFYDKSG